MKQAVEEQRAELSSIVILNQIELICENACGWEMKYIERLTVVEKETRWYEG